jgi:hypothetical protein
MYAINLDLVLARLPLVLTIISVQMMPRRKRWIEVTARSITIAVTITLLFV